MIFPRIFFSHSRALTKGVPMNSPAPCTPFLPERHDAAQRAASRSGRRARRSSTAQLRKPFVGLRLIAACAASDPQRRRFAVLAAALLLACCLPLLSACAPAAEHEFSLKVFENGKTTDSSETRIISAGSIATQSVETTTDDAGNTTMIAVDYLFPATIVSDEEPREVTYSADADWITLGQQDTFPPESRISLAQVDDNPVMALLYWLQTISKAPLGDSLTVTGEEASVLFVPVVHVEISPETWEEAHKEWIGGGDIQKTLNEDPENDALSINQQYAAAFLLTNGFITITATYDDGSTIEHTYTLAVHERNGKGDIASYALTDVTEH